MARSFKIATRSSPLALWQAQFFQTQLTQLGYTTELKAMTTEGDRISAQYPSGPNTQFFQKDSFVKGIQTALHTGEAEFAVHSLKDLPLQQPQIILALSPREDPRDTLISKLPISSIHDLGTYCFINQKTIGTNSPRRQDYLYQLFHHNYTEPIRGNIHTRLNRLDHSTNLAAIIVAQAALTRLNLSPRYHETLPLEWAPHAVGQGIMALESRHDLLSDTLLKLKNPWSDWFSSVERSLLIGLQGTCETSLGFNWKTTCQVQIFYQPKSSTIMARHTLQIPPNLMNEVLKKSLNLYTFEVWDWFEENPNWQNIQHHAIQTLLQQTTQSLS